MPADDRPAPYLAHSQPPKPSDLEGLIAAHRSAFTAFMEACDAKGAADMAYRAAHPKGFPVPDGFGGYLDGKNDNASEIKATIRAAFDLVRKRLDFAEIILSDSIAEAQKALANKEADALAAADAIFETETGELAAAQRLVDETSEAEMAAALAICAYPRATLEEVRSKAAYAATIPAIFDLSDELALPFIRSLAAEPLGA